MEPKHLISAAIAISAICHLALATGIYFADARPMEDRHEESVAVDLVTPQELAEAEKKAEETPPEPEKKPEKKPEPEFRLPDLTIKPTLEEQKTQAVAAKPQSSAQNTPPQPQKTSPQQPAPSAQQQKPSQQTPSQQPAQQQPPPQQQQQQQQQAQQQTQPAAPPPAAQPPLQQQAALQAQPPAPQPGPQQAPPQPEADITVKYGVMLGLPEGFGGGGGASEQADLSKLDIAAFRRHLRSCSKLPATVARGDDAKVKLRAVFSPDGRLVAEPTVIEVRRPAKAALLMQAAKQALEACQPYAMLPADKYDEWKVLDLDFTPQDFAG